MIELNADIKRLLDLSISLTGEKDYNKLLEGIIHDAMDITNCDGGTLYLAVPEGLKFMIMRTKSLGIYKGGQGEEIELPVVEFKESNVCAYCAHKREIINIEDVYTSELFDFTGPRKYDGITGYRTKSMLVMPLLSHEDEVLGVLQLINAMDDKGEVIPFYKDLEYIVYSIASQASVSLANLLHMREIQALMDSVIRAFTKAIDERSPYNANHTENVTRYCRGFAQYLNSLHEEGKFDRYIEKNDREQLAMAARLHDVGKLIVPLEVMDKMRRLAPDDMRAIEDRFEIIRVLTQLESERGNITQEQKETEFKFLEDALELVKACDVAGFITDEKEEQIRALARRTYTDFQGDEKHYLTDRELTMLSIKRGTLSDEEREIMQSHVIITANILKEIRFGDRYGKVLKTAASHHEFLDGSGYPIGRKGDKIPLEVRILTIADIFDSLVADDRPYKKAIPRSKARSILREMVSEGKLDGNLVELFCAYTEGEEAADEIS